MTSSYVDYAYYADTYLGDVIAETDFDRLALRASAFIDRLTFQRAASETDVDTVDSIKMATCAVAEVIKTVDDEGGADGIQSERVGNYSVTYGEGSEKQQTAIQKYREAAALYLGSTGLMYAGFAAGEYSGTVAASE